jgi:hypothetical protein
MPTRTANTAVAKPNRMPPWDLYQGGFALGVAIANPEHLSFR